MNYFTDLNFGKPFPSPDDQLHEFKIYGNINLKDFEFSSNWIFGSGKPYSIPYIVIDQTLLNGSNKIFVVNNPNLNTSRLPSYQRMDMSVSYHFNLGKVVSRAGLSIINVYNHNNTIYRNYQYTSQGNANGVNYEIIENNNVKALGFTPSLFIDLKI
jgi:hypothetical protein